jgi:hypothetical protein
MRCNPDGSHPYTREGSVDPAFILGTVKIPNDGGDW